MCRMVLFNEWCDVECADLLMSTTVTACKRPLIANFVSDYDELIKTNPAAVDIYRLVRYCGNR